MNILQKCISKSDMFQWWVIVNSISKMIILWYTKI